MGFQPTHPKRGEQVSTYETQKNQQSENSTNSKNNPIIDYIDFEDGYEQAVAAAFSDELLASINEEQPSFWRILESKNESHFPDKIIKFSTFIKSPDNLNKKLEFVGLIDDKSNIVELQNQLTPGQILISKSGEIWRWDDMYQKESKVLQRK